MRRPSSRLAATCAFVVAMLITAAGAAAGNGHGNENAPGQQKQDEATSQPAAPQQQWPDQQGAAVQARAQADHGSKGAAKHQQASGSSDASAGVKPSNSTSKWTHCRTGGTSASATCTAETGTPNTKADVSKRYGNGKTAAQIAVSRGAPAGTRITGPGNSQPHKVSDCRHKSNKSGGVDVHAVKSYSATCEESKHEVSSKQHSSWSSKQHSSCSKSEHGKGHGKHMGTCGTASVLTEKESCGKAKHESGTVSTCASVKSTVTVTTAASPPPVTATVTTAASPPPVTATTAASPPPVTATVSVAAAPVAPTPTQGVQSGSASAPAQSAPSNASSSSPATSQGGVLGAQTTLGKPKSQSGVLGTVGNAAGSTLPFTGFPVWVAVLIAVALGLAGFALYRRNAAPRL